MDEETQRRIREHAEKLAAGAPPLSAEQRARLYTLLFTDPPPKGVQPAPNLIYSNHGTEPDVRQSLTLDLKGLGVEPVTLESPLEEQAQSCWKVARHLALTSSGFKDQSRHGRRGWVGRFAMSDVHIQLLGGAGATADQLKRRGALVNQVLRKAQVAECLAHPRGATPTWWVSDTLPWDTLVAVVAHVRGQSATPATRLEASMSYAERQVTPAEAGETRAPAPVATTVETAKKKRGGGAGQYDNPAVRAAFEAQHQRRREAAEFADEAVLDTVRSAREPMTFFEVAWVVAGVTGMKRPDPSQHTHATGATTAVRRRLRQLADQGVVFARQETTAERDLRFEGSRGVARRGMLYWHSDPVPPRTTPQLVPEIPLYKGISLEKRARARPAPAPAPAPALPQDDEQRVLDALVAANRGLYVHGRSEWSLERRVPDVPLERLRLATDHLHRRGLLLRSDGRYMLEAWRNRLRRPERATPPPPQASDTAPLPAYVNDAPVKPAEAHTEAQDHSSHPAVPDRLRRLAAELEMVAEAYVEPVADSTEADLLRDEVLRLEEENGKLKQQVAGLRQALAAME